MHHWVTEANSGWVARAPAPAKIAAALGIIVATVLLPRRPDRLFLIPATVLFILWLGCRMPLRFALPRLVVAEFFILSMALLSWLMPSAAPVFISALLKSNLCVVAILLLNWTTPFHQVIQVLRHWRVPAIMVTTLALMYRYLPVLREESRRMQRARASRTFSRQPKLEWRNLSSIIAQLFVRSVDRAERIYFAMSARGWK